MMDSIVLKSCCCCAEREADWTNLQFAEHAAAVHKFWFPFVEEQMDEYW